MYEHSREPGAPPASLKKLISNVDALKVLRGWLLVVARKPA